ncbi:hypothetical protein Q9295_05750 [Xinfangfangia sp. CPCC 101601]|uniref:DUF2169 domain-containing protein n=1 Tax=Pseudogemmobacter lacusdianii TaxID=3069608 RepID=A0ABU0VVU3_9RHOB|nr:hypothetical protein [Xinfangfangia sp. CPCC 101601]MDQ2065866.1 hypothetical protein [Xinfangfangia sp. CPCC 101601]
MICTAPLNLSALQSPNRIVMVPEGVPSWGKEPEQWPRAYAHFDLPMPTETVRLTRRRRRENPPYFNAGMVMFPEKPPPGQSHGFGSLWLETALHFDWHCAMRNKRPWLDQITLPLTVKRFGYDYLAAKAELNFSISDRAYEPQAQPALIHYHRWKYLAAWPQSRAAFAALEKLAGPALAARLEADYGAILAEGRAV